MGNFDLLTKSHISIQDTFDKYKVGDTSDRFEEIMQLKPVFSFDYACLDGSKFSFNYNEISSRDYAKLIAGLRRCSTYSYEMLDNEKAFHFHEIAWEQVTIKESDFYKCIASDYDKDRDLTPYQFKVFEEARVIGFIYRSVFYLVMFDRGHNAYDRDRPKKMKKAKKKGKRNR